MNAKSTESRTAIERIIIVEAVEAGAWKTGGVSRLSTPSFEGEQFPPNVHFVSTSMPVKSHHEISAKSLQHNRVERWWQGITPAHQRHTPVINEEKWRYP
jgi:hypothetical protein